MKENDAQVIVENASATYSMATKAVDTALEGDGLLALPQHVGLQDLNKYQPYKRFYTGNFITKHIGEFVKWLVESKQRFADPVIIVSDEDMEAQAVLDHINAAGAPLHGYDTGKVKLKRSANYTELLNFVLNGASTHRKIAEFVEDNAHLIIGFDAAGNAIEPIQMAERIRNIKELKQQSASKIAGVTDDSMLYQSSHNVSSDAGAIPIGLKFTCEPYLGLPTRAFEVRFNWVGEDAGKMRIVNHEAKIEEMGIQFCDLLQEQMTEAEIDIKKFFRK